MKVRDGFGAGAEAPREREEEGVGVAGTEVSHPLPLGMH